jgi:hypothetical protein
MYHPHPPNDPFTPWTEFRWGSRGQWTTTGVQGVFIMAHVFIPNGIRAVLRGHASEGQELLHVFHFRAPTATPSAADCLAVNAIVNFWFANSYRNMLNTGVQGDDVVSTSIAVNPAPQAQTIVGVLGNRIGLFVTPGVTLKLKAGTGNSGRRNRGGQYVWPFISTDLLTPGNDRVTGTYRTAILGVFNTLVGQANTNGYPLCVRSGADAALKPIISYIAVDDYTDSISRRLLGHGR